MTTVLIAADPPTVPPGDGEPPGQPYVSPDDLASIQPLWAESVDEYLMPVVAEMWNDAAGLVHAQMVDATGVDLPAVSSLAAEQYLQQASNTFAEVGNDLWETARAELLAGFQAGESIDQLAARLRGSAGLTAKKAVLVARTQILDASNAGSIATVRASGVDMTKGWLATPDIRTRPTHVTAGHTYDEGGLVGMIPLADKFIVGGFEADRPHDPSLPPAERYNCRCTLSYGLPDEAIAQAREQATPAPALPNTSGAPAQPTLPPAPEGGISGVDYTDPALLESPHAVDIADALESGMSPQEIIDIYVHDDGFSEDIASLLVNETVAALRAQGRMPMPKISKRAAARARQQTIDKAEPVAQFAAEVDNVAYARQGVPFDAETAKIFDQRIVQAEASGIPEEELAGLRAAVKARDLRRIREEAQRLQDRYQLEAIGKAGEQMPFDSATMQGVGEADIPDGILVTVIRQGHRVTVKGEVVQLDRAVVSPAAEAPISAVVKTPATTVASARERWSGCRFCLNPRHPGPCAKPGSKAYERRHGKGKAAPAGGKFASGGGIHDEEQIHAAFDFHDPKTGMTATVSGIRPSPGGDTYIDIVITNPAGGRCGGGIRTLSADGQTVYHSNLAMNPDFGAVQGQGFATRFNAQAEAVYRANGVKKIQLTAGSKVGGYAWARAGYDFKDNGSRMEVARRADSAKHRYDPAVRREIDRVSRDPTAAPVEFAMIGHTPGAATWPGKEIMLGSVWDGVKYLD